MRYTNFLTAGEVITTSRSETLGSTRSAITAIGDTALLAHLDWINKDFHQSSFTEFGNEGWSWMHNDFSIRTVVTTALSNAVTPASTTITVDTDVWTQSGAGLLLIRYPEGGYDAISFSSSAANVFTIDTTKHLPSADHAIGAVVDFMYPLPSDFGRLEAIQLGDDYHLQETKLPGYPVSGQYKIWGDHILFHKDIGSELINIQYHKNPTTISNLSDELIIPQEFKRYAIEKLNAFIYRKRMKRQDAITANDEADMHLQKALGYDINISAEETVYADF